MPALPPVPLDVRRSLEQVREQVHGALDRWRHAVRRGREEDSLVSLARPVYRGPDLDVEETDDTVIVRAELPGLRQEDFTVEATADRLIIRGEKAEEREHGGRGFHRVERRYGSFVRTVATKCAVWSGNVSQNVAVSFDWKPRAVRNRPISTSGFSPASTRRKSFTIPAAS